MLIQQYKFSVEYSQNIVPDALSIEPITDENWPELDFVNNMEQLENEIQCTWHIKKFTGVQKTPEKLPDFTIANGKLFHHSSTSNLEEESWTLCIPKPQRERALLENHHSRTAGHLGSKKTMTRVCKNYYCPSIRGSLPNMLRSLNRNRRDICIESTHQNLGSRMYWLCRTSSDIYERLSLFFYCTGQINKVVRNKKHVISDNGS